MDQGVVKSLQKELKDKTFIGSFVGAPDFTELITYKRESIIFHSVVSNNPADLWTVPVKANYFKKFGLDCNPVSSLGTFDDFAELKAAVLEKME